MKKSFRKVLVIFSIFALAISLTACGGSSSSSSSSAASASDVKYPEKNIKLIVPWDAGGATDLLARTIADEVADETGVTVTVENKSGGNGAVGHNEGSSADPDGYTVTLFTTEASTSHLLGTAKFSYEDFTPVSLVAVGPSALAVPKDSEYDTLKDFVDAAKKDPSKIKIATQPSGGIWNLAFQSFEKAAGIDVKVVPFDGGAQSIAAVKGNQVDAVEAGFSEILPYVKSGDLKFLAVSSEEKPEAYPKAPTFKDAGYDVTVGAWWGIALPKDTPDDIEAAVEKVFKTAINSDAVKKFVSDSGNQFNYLGSDDFNKWLDEKDQDFKKVIK